MDDSALLAEMAEEFAARWRRGERPEIEEYAARHEALAERVRALFPTLMLLEGLAAGPPPSSAPAFLEAPRPGDTLGGYCLGREIGRGGMGVVFEAEHLVLSRRVAVKVLLLHGEAGARLERFFREARTAASLHHGNIVPVFDVGQAGSTPYYAMQLIDGVSLDRITGVDPALTTPHEECSSLPGATPSLRPAIPEGVERYRWVAEVGRQATAGLAHAHQRSVIHRDIKPSNLMIDGQGVVWITDFGLARRLEEDVALTGSGQLVGTPRYMSPEQATSARTPTDHRTDIYSLGATLYELLTGKPAFDGPTPLDVLLSIIERQPVPPRQLDPSLPRDLETVVLKAMAKRPEDRYPSAEEMGEDLRRFLDGEPVAAQRIGVLGRAVRWSKRNPALAALTAAMALSLLAGTIVSTLFAIHAGHERDRAIQSEEEAEARARAETAARREVAWKLYLTRSNLAVSAWRGDEKERLEELLDATTSDEGEDHRGWEWHFLHRQLRGELRHLDLRTQGWKESEASLTSSGQRVVSWLFDPTQVPLDAEVRDAQTGRLIRRRSVESGLLNCTRADGAVLAWADGKGVTVWDVDRDRDQVFKAIDGVDIKSLGLGNGVLALCPTGQRLAVGSRRAGKVALVDLRTGKTLRELIIPDAKRPQSADPDHYKFADPQFSPDGRWLAVISFLGIVTVWDTNTGVPALSTAGWGELAYSRRGQRVAFVAAGGSIRLGDLATGKDLGVIRGLESGREMSSVALSDNGEWLAASDGGGAISLTCVDGSQPSRQLLGHRWWVRGLTFLDGDTRLRSFSAGSVKDWDLRQPETRWFPAAPDLVLGGREMLTVPSADGSRLAFAHYPGTPPDPNAPLTISHEGVRGTTVKVVEAASGRMLFHSPPGPVRLPGGIALDTSGKTLARVRDCRQHEHWLHNPAQRLERQRYHLSHVSLWMPVGGLPDAMRILALGEEAASGCHVEVWDVATGQQRLNEWLPMAFVDYRQSHQLHGSFVVPHLSLDSRYLALEGVPSPAIWDLASGSRLAVPAEAKEFVHRVCFTESGRMALLVGHSQQCWVDIWDLNPLRRIWRFDAGRHPFPASGRLASDGGVLALAKFSVEETGTPGEFAETVNVQCWSLHDGACSIHETYRKVNFALSMLGSPMLLTVRGSAVAVACGNTLNIWNASSGKRLFRGANLGPNVSSLTLSPDGNRLAGMSHLKASAQPQLHLLDTRRGESLATFPVQKDRSGQRPGLHTGTRLWFRGHKLQILTLDGSERWELHTLDGSP